MGHTDCTDYLFWSTHLLRTNQTDVTTSCPANPLQELDGRVLSVPVRGRSPEGGGVLRGRHRGAVQSSDSLEEQT